MKPTFWAMKHSLQVKMPRKYKAVTGSEFRPYNPEEAWTQSNAETNEAGPSRKRRRQSGEGNYSDGDLVPPLEQRVICPCRKCERGDIPHIRLLSIVEDHVEANKMGTKWKVRNTLS
jgi:hypothetical protein